MEKWQKVVSIVLIALMCLSLLAACGNKGDSTTETSSTPATSGSTSSSPSPSGGTNSAAPPSPAETGQEPDLGGGNLPVDETATFADEMDIIIDDNVVFAINPFVVGAAGPGSTWSYTMMYDRLFAATTDINEQEPDLATEWYTDDWTTFTLKLRDDVYFQNGEKFTADDVVFTCNYAKEFPGTPAVTAVWQYVESVTALDDYTVEFNTGTVNVNFIFNLQNPSAVIVNEKAIMDDPEKGVWVGTGPFILTDFVANNYWVLERNDNFWGEPAITRKITFHYIPEIGNRTIMLLNGEAQLCMRTSPEDMEIFENNPDWTVFDRVINNPNPLVFNMDDPITGDYNFRMAVLHAIDRVDLAIAYNGNYGLAANDPGTLWGRYTEFRNLDIPFIPQDLDLAREYLEKSVYNGETLEVVAAATRQINATPVFQQQLEAIGIHTEIKIMEQAAMPAYTAWGNNQIQMYLSNMGTTFSASFIRAFIYPGAPSNSSGYNNPEVAELIDRAMVEIDYDTREQLWREVQRLVAEDVPFTNLFWIVESVVGVKGVGGFSWNTDAIYNMRYIYWQTNA